MARKTKRTPTPIFEPVVVDVRSLTNFAFNAGLTHESAEALFLAAPDGDCRIHVRPCPSEACGWNLARHLFAQGGYEGRELILCEDCGQVDLWV